MPRNPTSQAQIEPSRRNGAKSNGPVTSQERTIARAQFDRTVHGLLAKTIALSGESQEHFATLHEQLTGELQPQSTTEALMVEHLAASAWRIRREQAYERTFLAENAHDLAASAQTFRKAPIRKPLRYEAAAFNQFARTHRDPEITGAEAQTPENAGLPMEPEQTVEEEA